MGLIPPVVVELMANTGEFKAQMAEAQETMADTEAESEESAGGMSDAMQKGALIVGAAFVAASALAIDLADKYTESTSKLSAQADISQKAATSIGNAFLGQAFNTTFSAQETVEAYTKVAAQLGEVNGKALNSAQALGYMTQAQDLAEASGTSLASSTADIATVIQTYGQNINQAKTDSDILFNTSRLTGNSVDSVTQMLTRLKAGLGAAAPPLGQTSGLLLDLANNGETGRKGLMAATTALTSMLKPAATLATAQANLKTATDALPPSLQALAEKVTNGTISSGALLKATQGLSIGQTALFAKFTSANTAMMTAGYAAKTMGVSLTNAQGKAEPLADIIGQLHSQIAGMSTASAIAKLTADGFGTSAAKLVGVIQAGPAAFNKDTAAVTKANSAHEAAERATYNLHANIEKLQSGVEDLATRYGEVLIPVINVGVGAFENLTDWVGKNGSTLAKFGAIIGAIMLPAIVKMTAQVIVWGAQQVIAGAQAVGSFIATEARMVATTATVVAGFAAQAAGAVAAAAAFLLPLLPFILIGAAVVALAVLVVTHFTQIKAFIGKAVAEVGKVVGSVFSAIGTTVSGILNGISSTVSTVFTDIENIAKDIWGAIVGIITGYLQGIETVLSAVGGFLSGVWTAISNAAKTVWNAIVDVIKLCIDGIVEDIHIVEAIVGFLEGIWSRVTTGIGAFVGNAFTFFKNLPVDIMGVFASADTWLLDAGKQIVTGLINGIKGAAGDAVNAVKNLGGSILSSAKGALGIHSPSTLFAEIGGNIGAGLVQGIVGSTGAVAASAAQLSKATAITPAIPNVSTVAANASASGANGSAVKQISIEYNIPVTGDMSPQTANIIKQMFQQHDQDLITLLEAM